MSETLTPSQAADQAARVIAEINQDGDAPLEIHTDPERTRETVAPNFSRMRTEWTPDDAREVQGVMRAAEGAVRRMFPDAFLLLNELWGKVRIPEVNRDTGELLADMWGWPVWQKVPSGAYVEDYSNLTNTERERFLLGLASMGVEWGQRSGQAWLEAMLAKVRWEESFAEAFIGPTGRLTVEERTQRGRAASTEHRYHAVFRAAVSRAAQELVADLEKLGQRIKDATAM